MSEVRGSRSEVRGPRQSFSAFAIRQNKVPLTLQGCHELLTMIHFITGNNNELLTMIHLSKHISLLNQQSVCNSPHHILTFSQLTVLSCMMMLIDSTVNCENVRKWCRELHTDCWFNKDIRLMRWIMVNRSWLLPMMKWIMVNSSWHSCSVRGTLAAP